MVSDCNDIMCSLSQSKEIRAVQNQLYNVVKGDFSQHFEYLNTQIFLLHGLSWIKTRVPV